MKLTVIVKVKEIAVPTFYLSVGYYAAARGHVQPVCQSEGAVY